MINPLSPLPERLCPWFQTHQRDLPWRKDREPYHVWLSEIMLQQTRVEAVKGYYRRFLQSLPAISDLAAVPETELFKLWEGLGYYSRARNLQRTAKIVVEAYDGIFPKDYAAIRALPGIGDYTAGAIASICYDLPVPAVDGNVVRVLSRFLDDHNSGANVKKHYSALLEEIYPQEAGMFTQALMELGAVVCVPNGAPDCGICPICDLCLGNRNHTAAELPVRAAKKPRREENLTVFLLTCGNCTALRRRPETGLLAGLYEFPNVPGTLTVEEMLQKAEAWGLHPQYLEKTVERSHIFTHIRWNMTGARIHCGTAGDGFLWADRKTVEEQIALPTAFRQFLPDIWEESR